MHILVVDSRTLLEPVGVGHAPPLHALIDAGRPRLAAWLPWVPETRSIADVSRFVARSLHDRASGTGFDYVLKHDGDVCGIASLNYIDTAGHGARLGYWIAEPFEGRGLMSAACRSLLQLAFREIGLERVEVHAAVDNLRSRSLAERLGGQLARIQPRAERIGERELDHAVYEIIAREVAGAGDA